VKDRGFGIMRENRISIIIIEDFNLVLPKATQSAKMEILRVFITKGNVFYFCPLSPIDGALVVFLTQLGFCQEPKTAFEKGEMPSFLKLIQKGNDGTTVDKVERGKLALPSPRSGRRANAL
jgi:hypothetical protein